MCQGPANTKHDLHETCAAVEWLLVVSQVTSRPPEALDAHERTV